MSALRYALSGMFVAAVLAGLILLVRSEAHGVPRAARGEARGLLLRPATWFLCAAILFGAVVTLTILFPSR